MSGTSSIFHLKSAKNQPQQHQRSTYMFGSGVTSAAVLP
jgi:hypothetical protein